MDETKAKLDKMGAGLAEKFYGNLKSKVRIEKKISGNAIDYEWIDCIEFATEYINNIFESPKRFIVNDEIILNVEKSKKVTIDSVKHLSKHTNFISKYDVDKDEVTPEKLLNVLKEDTFNTYENRFIYTLVNLIGQFVDIQIDKIKDADNARKDKFIYVGSTSLMGENVNCQMQIDSIQDTSKSFSTSEMMLRINKIKSNVSGWKQTDVYQSLEAERVARVTNPIKRTNVILKNPNFQQAVILWDYLYSKLTDDENNNKQNETDVVNEIPRELKKFVENGYLINYLVMKMANSNTEIQREMYMKYAKNIAMKIFGESVELVLDIDKDVTQNEFLDTLSERFSEVKFVKKNDSTAVENKIKLATKEFIDKVEDSYFDIGSEDDENA